MKLPISIIEKNGDVTASWFCLWPIFYRSMACGGAMKTWGQSMFDKFLCLRAMRSLFFLGLLYGQFFTTYAATSPRMNAATMSGQQLFDSLMKYRVEYTTAVEATNKEPVRTREENEFGADAWNELIYKRAAKADPYVLKLLNYYMGESADGIVYMSLLCRRTRILPALRKIKRAGPQCQVNYQKVCVDKELWEVRVEDINKILSNKERLYPKSCLGTYSKVMGKSVPNSQKTLLIK
jgi:hypothetical protein